MNKNNKNTIKFMLIEFLISITLISITLISITLISGCIESDKQEFKPLTEETNVTNESKIEEINESEIENISDVDLEDNLSTNVSRELNFTNKTPETVNITENITEEEQELEYLFSWDNVPGNDNARFIKFLEEYLGIYWAKSAKIRKSDDNKKITANYGRNSINLELKERENKITIETIKVTEREDYDFIFETENGKLKIYSTPRPEPKPESQIKRIKFNIPGLLKSGDAGLIDSKLKGLAGVIYTNVNSIDKNGEVLFDTLNITTEEVLKEAGFIKTPGGLIVLDLTTTLTEEINCTKYYEYYCCGKEDCKLYP